ncbi:uncharacterized protein BYT42DRAFT_548300 [Radiomyces spectabilis]|uniref:uncharacterized protein n=1 Tax=Radiomyces spectabilis TaxID=64574 RepID=UPI002220DF92|nr:uncharacterized protein BYT42DRAFT_548300 [Radiomyces spectabilis]KAI8371430.1 hypothetical protein BYT42DRAFT_548300 [Radiomyces spectabilis]
MTTSIFLVYMLHGYRQYRQYLKRDFEAGYPEESAPHIISRNYQWYSMRKRSMFGTVLGAIGYFIYSTCLLLFQSFISPVTCDLLLWGTLVGFYTWTFAFCWRAYRLHFLMKLNVLRQRFMRTSNPLRTNRQYDPDYQWFMENKNFKTIDARRPIAMYITSMSVIIVICAVCEVFARQHMECQFEWGNYLQMGCFAVFIVVIAPFNLWYLRGIQDTHGIRNELMLSLTVGFPLFVLYVVWLFVLPPRSPYSWTVARGVYSASNWALLMMATGHTASVVVPLFDITHIIRLILTNLVCHGKCSLQESEPVKQQPKNARNQRGPLELNSSSLKRALSERETIRLLREWAIKDFSVENIIFFEYYFKLGAEVKKTQITPSFLSVPSTHSPLHLLSKSSTASSSIRESPMHDILTTPVGPGVIPYFIEFYETFICDTAPLQVNISYKAKQALDVTFYPFVQKRRRNSALGRPEDWDVAAEDIIEAEDANMSDKAAFVDFTDADRLSLLNQVDSKRSSSRAISSVQCHPPPSSRRSTETSESSTMDLTLTLAIFDDATKEVFWNIFSGLFPKVVEDSKKCCNK